MSRINEENIPNEKAWFTKNRNLLLNKFSSEERNNILELEKKYGKYCFLPLDIPKIETSKDFVNWYFENAKASIKQNTDIATQYTGNSSFLTIDVLPQNYDASKSVWSKNIISNFEQQWPDLWQQFYEYFPFKKIIGLTIWSSIVDIDAHRDQTIYLDLPLEFRTLIHDPNPENNLFVGESLPNADIGDYVKTISVPNRLESNSFVWNNLRSRHFSKFNESYKKIIIIFHYVNKIDWHRYESLISRSIQKYQDRSLISENDISLYVY